MYKRCNNFKNAIKTWRDSCTSFFDNNGYNKFLLLKKYRNIVFVIIMFLLVFLFRIYIIDKVVVSGNSMADTFQDGDMCWVKKFNLELQRDDVVILNENGKRMIKRIVGLPNETIRIKNGIVYINGTEYTGNYSFYTETSGVAKNEIKLNDDEYFLLGDNRSHSLDSRIFGSVKKENIIGKVVYRYFPLNRIGNIAELN